jgi:hypothetical protein
MKNEVLARACCKSLHTFEELIGDQGEITTIMEYNSQDGSASILSYSPIPNAISMALLTLELSCLYLQASSPDILIPRAGSQHYALPVSDFESHKTFARSQDSYTPTLSIFEQTLKRKGVVTKKKYKPVAQKVKSVIAELPKRFRINRQIIGDPLEHMPSLNPNPLPFIPTGRYTCDRRDTLDQKHKDFLWPAEFNLMHDFMCQQNTAFAWDNSK